MMRPIWHHRHWFKVGSLGYSDLVLDKEVVQVRALDLLSVPYYWDLFIDESTSHLT